MAGGFLGLPGLFGTSPMGALGAMPPEGSAPSPSPAPGPAPVAADPPTTGAIPAPAASAAAPERGFGDVMSDMFSGRGIMGARPGDDKVDPNTGISAGQQRQLSMQSMMGMGLTLLAAGMRQTNDQRAAILAGAPKLLDQTDQINNFAKTRLEMANARLKERQAQQAEDMQKRYSSLFGGSGASTLGPASAAPVVGAPGAVPASIGGADASAQATQNPGMQTTQNPAPAVGGGAGILAGIPPATQQLLSVLPPEEGIKKMIEIRRGLDEMETIGDPYQDKNTGKWIADKFKNGKRTGIVDIGTSRELSGPASVDPDTGRKVQTFTRDGQTTRTDNLGDVPRPISIETMPDGRQMQVTKNAAGQNVSMTALPEAREGAYATAQAKQYVDYGGEIRKQASEGRRMTGLLNDFQKAIDDPNVYFGPGADKVAGAKAIAKSFGMDVAGVDTANLATKVQNQLALMVRNPEGGFGGMPGSTSDRDVSFLISSVPSLMVSREGAQLVKDTFQSMATRNLEVDKMRRDYLRTHKELDSGFEDMVADKFDQPLLSEAQRAQVERLSKAPSAAAPEAAGTPAMPKVGDVMDGHRYKGGPPDSPSSWEKVK